jgi:hypothetical protein
MRAGAAAQGSQKSLTELGLDAEAVIEIPYLTEDEAKEIVLASGGDPDRWGRIAFAAGAQGHPQLVHAVAMGMAARGWPRSELREIVIRGFSSDDTMPSGTLHGAAWLRRYRRRHAIFFIG